MKCITLLSRRSTSSARRSISASRAGGDAVKKIKSSKIKVQSNQSKLWLGSTPGHFQWVPLNVTFVKSMKIINATKISLKYRFEIRHQKVTVLNGALRII